MRGNLRYGRGMLAVAAATMLGACAPGDFSLTEQDLADRAGTVAMRDHATHLVGFHESQPYYLRCLDGKWLTRTAARITAVSGPSNRVQDYRLTVTHVSPTTAVATVTHVGPDLGVPARYVTVWGDLRCQPLPAR